MLMTVMPCSHISLDVQASRSLYVDRVGCAQTTLLVRSTGPVGSIIFNLFASVLTSVCGGSLQRILHAHVHGMPTTLSKEQWWLDRIFSLALGLTLKRKEFIFWGVCHVSVSVTLSPLLAIWLAVHRAPVEAKKCSKAYK